MGSQKQVYSTFGLMNFLLWEESTKHCMALINKTLIQPLVDN